MKLRFEQKLAEEEKINAEAEDLQVDMSGFEIPNEEIKLVE